VLIVGGNQSAAGYDIENAIRLDESESAYLNRTFGTGGDSQIFTFSFWVKKPENENQMNDALMLFGGQQSSYPAFQCLFLHTNDTIFIKDAQASNNIQLSIKTRRRFMDVASWYHIVFAVDTTQATASDRAKLYVNGVLETQLDGEGAGGGATSTPLYPPQNTNLQFGGNEAHYINQYATNYEDLYMAEFCYVDGQQLDPTSFGEFDSASGIWKPIDVSGLSFGTEGSYLDFSASGSLGADASGNGNNWTLNGATGDAQTIDTPTNNAPILNIYCSSLHRGSTNTMSFSGLRYKGADATEFYACSTIPLSSGKWYWEARTNFNTQGMIGIISDGDTSRASGDNRNNRYPGQRSWSWGYKLSDGNIYNDGSGTAYGNSIATGDIMSFALDLDNGYFYVGKNGTWQNSGDPTSGATGTGGVDISSITGNVLIACGDDNGAGYNQFDFNFGAPFYSITSGNSDGNGYGNFEHSVPTDYYMINSKNLAEYG